MESQRGVWPLLHASPQSDSPIQITPHKAGVVGNALVLALIALFQMTAEGGGPAQFDGTHDAALGRGERSRMLFTIGFAITTQHVGDFQLGTIHEPALSSTEP
jgi:hypothetical protein